MRTAANAVKSVRRHQAVAQRHGTATGIQPGAPGGVHGGGFPAIADDCASGKHDICAVADVNAASGALIGYRSTAVADLPAGYRDKFQRVVVRGVDIDD